MHPNRALSIYVITDEMKSWINSICARLLFLSTRVNYILRIKRSSIVRWITMFLFLRRGCMFVTIEENVTPVFPDSLHGDIHGPTLCCVATVATREKRVKGWIHQAHNELEISMNGTTFNPRVGFIAGRQKATGYALKRANPFLNYLSSRLEPYMIWNYKQ